MNSIAIKANSVATENGRVETQVSCDKCFYVATKFLSWDQLKEEFMSRHNIQSSQQRATGLCRDKDYFCRNKQNMRLK